ncbi:MAG: hypothetical protein AB7O21_03175 [Gammaproteobacteria bacterium]
MSPEPTPSDVARLGPRSGAAARALATLCLRHGLAVVQVGHAEPIPGSYWGPPEAGLLRGRLYVRADTPLTSALHEACHYFCMDDVRRRTLDTDAGGDPLEECAVCYLSVLLADQLPGYGQDAMLLDMDRWGYSYRLGSARAWFEEDAEDARAWLERAGWVDAHGRLTAAHARRAPA